MFEPPLWVRGLSIGEAPTMPFVTGNVSLSHLSINLPRHLGSPHLTSLPHHPFGFGGSLHICEVMSNSKVWQKGRLRK